MDKTIDYYNMNANDFYESTVSADMSTQYDMFEKRLYTGAHILDCGCGSGRDSKYFLSQGYEVTAIDGSEELCKKASNLTGLEVENMYFKDIDFEDEFDGVWACASLLHVSLDELPIVLKKISKAMKNYGVLYISFKYGDFNGERNGRFFADLNEDSFERIVDGIPEFILQEKCISEDVRPGRTEKWLNAIIVKREKQELKN
ncbi:MAG: class I SAM-dependent methyltransferase [Fretibacterium sp.]|nr:class I SAM-dependent methyltransferase [Fretibacterium sp.]